jgi:pimeloyl-ACP methyl ester carboxylesterase
MRSSRSWWMIRRTNERGFMSSKPDTVVLIHGLWMTSSSFEGWAERYRAAGLTVLNDGWPGMQGSVEDLRRDPSAIAGLSIKEIIDHYDRLIRGLPQPPIIMGHSFGGAFAQVLVDRGLGSAGVAIDSAAVKGILKLPWSTLRTGWPILRNPLNRRRAVPISVKQFQYRFTNHLSVDASKPLHERYCISAAGRVLFEGASANFKPGAPTKVDFRNDRRAPLLLIAGGIDHVSPPSLNRANFKKYGKSNAVIDFKVFDGRSHFTLGQDGWEAVADYALDWAINHSATDLTTADAQQRSNARSSG